MREPLLTSVSEVLRHPLFILVVGAAVSSLLIPSITRRWQDRQKALELKAGLLERLSDAANRLITHAWFMNMGGKDKLSDADRSEFDWRHGEWEIESRKLQTQLEAYFAHSPEIAQHWSQYRDLLRTLHELSWQKMKRTEMLAALQAAYDDRQLWSVEGVAKRWFIPRAKRFTAKPVKSVDWMAFTDTRNFERYMERAWPRFKLAMEAPLAPLAESILYADVATMRS